MSEWMPVQPELDPPETVIPLPHTAIHIGWREHLGLDWRLDVVLASARFGAHLRFVPAVVVSPLLSLPLDIELVRSAFSEWAEAAQHCGHRPEDIDALAVPMVREVLLRPLTGPLRTCPRIQADGDYWENRRLVIAQGAHHLAALDGGEAESASLERVIVDYPSVIATLPSTKRLWRRTRPRTPPSRADSMHRIPDRQRRGRPRRAMVPHLAGELLAALPDGRTLRSKEWDEQVGRFGPLKARWALVTALDLVDESEDPLVLEVMRWAARHGDPHAHDPLEAKARVLQKYVQNRADQTLRGRQVRPGVRAVRRIVPYISPDLSVYPRRVSMGTLRDPVAMDHLLVDWIRSDRFRRMMQIVAGLEPQSVRTRSSDGSLARLLEERHGRFLRVSARFRPDNPAYRGAVAMIPGVRPEGVVELELTGFGATCAEVLDRWLAGAAPDNVGRGAKGLYRGDMAIA